MYYASQVDGKVKNVKKSRKAEICHIRFFIYQNPCLGMVKSLSWAVTKYRVEVGWAVTKYQVGSMCGVVSKGFLGLVIRFRIQNLTKIR